MRRLTLTGLITLIMVLGVALVAVPGAPPAVAQGDEAEPAHLVTHIDDGTTVSVNRMDWDVNAFAPVFPGTAVRASDFLDLSGRATVIVLCTDLTVLNQRGSEVPRCDPYPADPAFYYLDDPAWAPPDGPLTVVTQAGGPVPDGIDASGINRNELTGDQLAAVATRTEAILDLDLDAAPIAFALASYYRTEDMLFDALAVLTALPDLECSERRPTVEPPEGEARPLVKSPVLYLRIGELYQLLGAPDAARRNYFCAAELAGELNAPADEGLAFARQAKLAQDTAEAINLYQRAIDDYAGLGALDAAESLLEICGLRNCALP